MFIFNECHIHLYDCTWLNVFHILNFCWSNTKWFLSVLIVLGKSFVFAKISKISKNSVALFWRLGRRSSQSHALVASLHRRFLQLIGGSMSQSQKRQKIFQNYGLLKFSQLGLATYSWMEAPIARLYKNFCGSLHDFLTGGPSNHEKHLDKFFKNFVTSVWWLVLATCTRLVSIAKNMCFALLGQVLKLFSFPSNIFYCSLSCPFISLSNSLCFSQKPPLFFIISTSILKKRYGFSYFL